MFSKECVLLSFQADVRISFLSMSLASLASVTSFDVTSDVVPHIQPMEMLFKSFFGASFSGMQKEGMVLFHCSFL